MSYPKAVLGNPSIQLPQPLAQFFHDFSHQGRQRLRRQHLGQGPAQPLNPLGDDNAVFQ